MSEETVTYPEYERVVYEDRNGHLKWRSTKTPTGKMMSKTYVHWRCSCKFLATTDGRHPGNCLRCKA